MIQLSELFHIVSYFLFTLLLYFLSGLSKKLGEVMGMKKYYYLYYAGMVLTSIAYFIMIMNVIEYDIPKLYAYLFLAMGLTCGLAASIKYWGWLIIELFKG